MRPKIQDPHVFTLFTTMKMFNESTSFNAKCKCLYKASGFSNPLGLTNAQHQDKVQKCSRTEFRPAGSWRWDAERGSRGRRLGVPLSLLRVPAASMKASCKTNAECFSLFFIKMKILVGFLSDNEKEELSSVKSKVTWGKLSKSRRYL